MGVRSLLAGRVGLVAIAADLIVRFLELIARNDGEEGSRLARSWFCADGPCAGWFPPFPHGARKGSGTRLGDDDGSVFIAVGYSLGYNCPTTSV